MKAGREMGWSFLFAFGVVLKSEPGPAHRGKCSHGAVVVTLPSLDLKGKVGGQSGYCGKFLLP